MKARAQRWAAAPARPLETLQEDARWRFKLAAVSVLLSVLLTWPGVLHLNSEVIGSPDADGGKHFWTLWWIKHNVVALNSIPHQTTLVNFPEGMALYPIEPLNGLGVSLLFFLPLVLATNLLALINMSLTGFFGGLLGRELTGSKNAGLVCGILLQSSAFSMFTLHAGVGELQHLWWLPVCFLLWHRLRSRLQWRYSVGLGLALASATLSCFYYGLFAGMGVALLSLSTLWAGRKTPKLLLQYAIAAGLGLAIVLPVSSQFASSFGEGEPPRVGLVTYITDASHGQPVTDPPSARLQLSDLVQSADRALASREEIAYAGGRYLGLPALILLVTALVLVPRRMIPWLLVGITGVVFGLGSYLVSGGEVATTAAGARYEMPFLFLNRALGYLVEPVNFSCAVSCSDRNGSRRCWSVGKHTLGPRNLTGHTRPLSCPAQRPVRAVGSDDSTTNAAVHTTELPRTPGPERLRSVDGPDPSDAVRPRNPGGLSDRSTRPPAADSERAYRANREIR